MQIYNSLDEVNIEDDTVVAVGNFEGLHTGHQALLNKTIEIAQNKNIKSAVFTFSNHPKNFFEKNNEEKEIRFILDPEEKLKKFEKMGIDYLVNVPFNNEIMEMEPVDFIKSILVDKFHIRAVVCGFNYRYGSRAEGNTDMLTEYSKKYDYEVFIKDPVKIDGKIVSSTYIRQFIETGDMENAQRFLASPFSLYGTVINGNKIGQTIGFPTANIKPEEIVITPPNGVYCTNTIINGRKYESITNVGVKPTIGNYSKRIETNIFDFNQNIYGQYIQVEFLKMMRSEKKFSTIEELEKQIKIDIENAVIYHKERQKL